MSSRPASMLGRMSSMFSPLALTNTANPRPDQDDNNDDASDGMVESSAHLEQDEDEEEFSPARAVAMSQFCLQDSSSDEDNGDEELDDPKQVSKVSPPPAKKLSSTKRKPDNVHTSSAKKKKMNPKTAKSCATTASGSPRVQLDGTPIAKEKAMNGKSPSDSRPIVSESIIAGTNKTTEKETKTKDSKPAVTPTPNKKRLTPLEQVETTSLQASQALIEVCKHVHKFRQDRLRQLQKDVKIKQQELEQLQAALKEELSSVGNALKDKRAAVQQFKALERQWTKAKEAQASKVSKAVTAAEKKLLQEQRRALVKSETNEKSAKGRTSRGKSPVSKRNGMHDDSDSSDADSDWEGKVSSSTKATETKRVTTLRQKASQWRCSCCTYNNGISRRKCEMCQTLRSGVLPDDNDLEDDE